jgi:RNA-splicing ligase RtcB
MTANHKADQVELETTYKTHETDMPYNELHNAISLIVEKIGMKKQYIFASIGSLGGGNHFIEVDETEAGELYLVVHSGSRNFGKNVAEWHQNVAVVSHLTVSKREYEDRVDQIKKITKGREIQIAIGRLRKSVSTLPKDLEYLSGENAKAYYQDMRIAQIYALLNRRVMLRRIVEGFYGQEYKEDKIIESVHNYVDFKDITVRKGAISAHKGEKVIVPLNMAAGILLGIGKGNEEWNCSGPHGAGRKMSRTKAKATIPLVDFQSKMLQAGVWSSSVSSETLDEAPQVYKDVDKTKEFLAPTIDVVSHMKAVYNFKASEGN